MSEPPEHRESRIAKGIKYALVALGGIGGIAGWVWGTQNRREVARLTSELVGKRYTSRASLTKPLTDPTMNAT